MMKGILSMLIAALVVTVVLLGVFYLIGILAWLAGILVIGIIFAAILIFVILLAISIVIFFALFYYMAEKKPSITPGHYTLDNEKGKDEK